MNRIMCHLVSHYPDFERSLLVAETFAEAGAAYLEIQFPFTDPMADGPAIQEACTRALEAGFTVKEGFRLVSEAARRGVPVFLMTYGSLAVRRGVGDFLKRARDAGVEGVIVPDLPYDQDEGLYDAGASLGVDVVPVLIPGMPERRLEGVRATKPRWVYTALRTGITGSKTELGEANLGFLDLLADWGTKILAGFGISSREQVEALMGRADAAVVGSRFVRVIAKNAEAGAETLRRELAATFGELV